MNFNKFCTKWVDFCIELQQQNLTKWERGKIKGDKFEEVFYNILLKFVPKGYQIMCQKKIGGLNYKFDYIFAKSNSYDIKPEGVIAAFEVKAHGFYGYKDITKLKNVFENLKNLNSKVNIYYITFRETNTYDKKVREILKDFLENYYRFSDSGDGVQLPPKKYFPESWDRLNDDLVKLKNSLS